MAEGNLRGRERSLYSASDGFRLGYVSVLAGIIGVAAAVIAYFIYHFIGLLYNVFFYRRLTFTFV